MTATIRLEPSSRSRSESPARPLVSYALWTVQVLLALLFVYAGAMKFVMSADDMTKDIDLSVPFLRLIGACEVLGGFGLILPGLLHMRRALTPVAGSGLAIIMIGAVVVTVASMGVLPALFPLVVGLLVAFVVRGRWRWLTAS